MTTLRIFTEENAHRFWNEGKHLKDCKQQVYAFCSFADHDNRSISEFKASDVFKFTDSLMVSGLRVSTVNRYKCALKKIFREAVDMEECTKAPIIKFLVLELFEPSFFGPQIPDVGGGGPGRKHCSSLCRAGGKPSTGFRQKLVKQSTDLIISFLLCSFWNHSN